MKPCLENLEDRLVPATYVWNYTAASAVLGSGLFSDPASWMERTPGGILKIADTPPGPGTDCVFSDWNIDCTVNSSQACRSITTTGWYGKLKINGSLNVWGSNGADSVFNNGTIEATSNDAKLNVLGGQFTFGTSTLNTNPAFDFNVYVNRGGTFLAGTSAATLNASFNVGLTPSITDPPSAGTLKIDAAANISNASNNITVASTGTLNVNSSLAYTNINSTGTVNLNGGSLGLKTGGALNVTGGTLRVADVETYAIAGNVKVTNASMIMGTLPGVCTSLIVLGSFELGNGSSFSVDVLNSSLTKTDNVQASNITIGGTASLYVYSTGPLANGDHNHVILTSANDIVGSFGSEFFFGTVWDIAGPANSIVLTFVDLPNDEPGDPPMMP
jgi:hypothetical protein